MHRPTVPHHDVVVVGSGFAGLAMAINLLREGIEDFVVLERAGSVGGTWRDNHYPGCACDVPTPLYSFSFAPNPEWSHLYARHHEIRRYLEDCTDRFGVRPHLRFGADLRESRWEDDEQRWHLRLGDGRELTARVVIGGFGALNEPVLPDIEGIEDFAGPLFHSAAWRHDVDLAGKRVAVIGTGASAIQLIPEVAKVAARVDVYQRTAPWIFPRLDRRFTRTEKALFRRVPLTQRLLRSVIYAIQEAIAYPLTKRPAATRVLKAVALAHLRRRVRDPELRRRLTPSYDAGCKRMLVANDYLPAMTRPNVELVTDGIARVTPAGIVTADGREREIDVLVSATGFRIEEVFERMSVHGRDGRTLADAWADGVEAHRGTTVAGFPNLFLLSGPNTGTGSTSQVFMIEAQVHYVLEALRAMRGGVADVRADAQAASNAALQGRMEHTVWLTGGCKSWYLDEQGRNRTLYPGFSTEFRRSLRSFRADEYLLEPARAPQAAVAVG